MSESEPRKSAARKSTGSTPARKTTKATTAKKTAAKATQPKSAVAKRAPAKKAATKRTAEKVTATTSNEEKAVTDIETTAATATTGSTDDIASGTTAKAESASAIADANDVSPETATAADISADSSAGAKTGSDSERAAASASQAGATVEKTAAAGESASPAGTVTGDDAATEKATTAPGEASTAATSDAPAPEAIATREPASQGTAAEKIAADGIPTVDGDSRPDSADASSPTEAGPAVDEQTAAPTTQDASEKATATSESSADAAADGRAGDGERDEIAVHNPATGEVVGAVPAQSAGEVAAAVRELRLYQAEWEALGASGRKKWLLKLQDWLIDHTDRLADVVQSETGKPRVDALIDSSFAVDLLGYYARRAGKFLADEHPSPHSPLARVKRLTTAYRPYPVVGVITPWNFPLAMPALDVIPALAAGAAVLLKPSEVTPLSALELARGWAEIGAPPVFTVVTGARETGAAVVDSVDYVQFTGSTATGKRIAAACVERLVPYSLELGGKDPAIVLADADIDRAAYGVAFGGLFNSGQVCISVERVYVEAPIYDEFVEKLTAHVRELRQGADGREPENELGAMANEAQKAIVARHIQDAITKGARVLTGGKATGVGTFFEPTVLVEVDHEMACMTEETFGPTLPVMKVADEAEAIALANDSIYGLSASVWTGDKSRWERIARQLNAGAVNINDVFANLFNFALPMGGWQQSGVGARWGGAEGLRKYCRKQAITTPMLPTQQKEPFWFPYSPGKLAFALSAMRAAGARGMRRLGVLDVINTVGGKGK